MLKDPNRQFVLTVTGVDDWETDEQEVAYMYAMVPKSEALGMEGQEEYEKRESDTWNSQMTKEGKFPLGIKIPKRITTWDDAYEYAVSYVADKLCSGDFLQPIELQTEQWEDDWDEFWEEDDGEED